MRHCVGNHWHLANALEIARSKPQHWRNASATRSLVGTSIWGLDWLESHRVEINDFRFIGQPV